MELEISKEITDVALVAKEKIDGPLSLELASTALILGKGLVKKIRDYFAPLKQGAHAAWKGICDRENEELAKITPSVTVLERTIADYRLAEERKRREAEEDARKRKEELDRLAEKTLLEAQAAPPAEQDRILKEAAAREKAVAPPPPIPKVQATPGLAPRTYYSARVNDIKALARAVIEGKVAADAILPNQVFLNDLATKTKGAVQIPGVEWMSETRMMKTR